MDLFADRTTEPPGPPAPKVWTVSQVNRAVRRLLEETLPQLWVTGEVANFNRHRSGHCYFTLKDRSAQIRCVMFRREAATLPTDPEEGMTLRVFGGLTLYEARGSYQFVVTRLEAESAEGMWKLAFERLRQRLDAEGLTDPARKRSLPDFPRTVGVVTSATSAALRDILAVTARRAPWVRVLVRGTGVQGPGAGRQIAAAIDTVAAQGVDVVIVARGGGSIEDLWGFNEEPVARAVAACSVPVVSGVGHETDVTICDLVADLRAATPSAAAEAVAPDGRALGRRLAALGQRLGRALSGQARARRWRLDRARERLFGGARRLTSAYRQRLQGGRVGISQAMQGRIRRRSARLKEAAAAMEALSPLSTLARGYAVPLDANGRLLRGVGDFVPAERFRLRVVDGNVPCEVADRPTRES
ncbi:MAG: exodeoxyribonuclease VII large subunit [Gemmatimonadetes bacterium]|nr:exodeoxyribonuclease VII large subunit [Gemmatimonadota bacterium]MYG21079.1 exodeoxyribonuclease VII large subunit [Gemmatimonadota bacterium]MYJ37232.1 exodeoxyribonuclease VII large subunit [Gemmatimonadota bacterium]